jgi:lipoprotein NlpI
MPDQPANAPTQPLPPIGFVLALLCGGFLYLGMMALLADYQGGHEDAMGRALAAAFAYLFGLGVWVMLGILLLIAALKGEMPQWAKAAVAILLPLSAIAAGIAADQDRDPGIFWWGPLLPAALPMMLPPLFAIYAIWARFPRLHRVLPPNPTSLALLGIVLVLAIAPVPQLVVTQQEQAAEAAAQMAAQREAQTKEDKRRADNRARFEKLTDDTPLWEWAVFIGKDSELDKEAVEGARKLTHRQADAETALRRGIGFPLVEYGRLDLAATPALCEAAGDFLRQIAVSHPAPEGDAQAAYAAIEQNFGPYVDSVEWLTQQNCAIDDAVARLAVTVAASPASSSRDAFLGYLAWRQGNGFYKREAYDRALVAYGEAIRNSPENAQYYDSRGNVYYDMEDSDRAIADYGEAIRFNQGYSSAFDSRGNAYHQKGDDDHALPDYDEAIRLNPGFALAFNNRGALYIDRGEHARAIADFDAALRLAPKFRTALFNRGRTKFYTSDYAGAAADLSAASALKSADPYAVLWLYLARMRAGQPAQEALRTEAAGFDRSEWPGPVVAAYLGETDAAAVLAAARSDDPATQKSKECEAWFYLGAKAATEGNPTAARDLLTKATTVCPRYFIEAPAARFELARLPQ